MKIYVVLICVAATVLSCSKMNDPMKSSGKPSNEIDIRLNALMKNHEELSVTTVDSKFDIKKGVLVEFKSYDDLDTIFNSVLKGYKDSIFLRYNPEMEQKMMEECEDVLEGGAFAPTVFEGFSAGSPHYNVTIVLPTMNPFVSYGVNFRLDPVPGGCGTDLSGNPITSYESTNFDVYFYGFVPDCMTIENINGYSTYTCFSEKIATTVDWVAKLTVFGASLSVPMSYTHTHQM